MFFSMTLVPLAHDVDIGILVELTEGRSFAELDGDTAQGDDYRAPWGLRGVYRADARVERRSRRHAPDFRCLHIAGDHRLTLVNRVWW